MSLKELKPRLQKVMRTKPRKFQAQGIRFLERNKGRAIVGDDMGVGKTIQVLGYLALHPEVRPVVIVCPANAKYEWEDQINQHIKDMKCEVLTGQKPYKTKADVLIVNYDIVSYWKEALAKLGIKGLVMDECHKVKNLKTQRTATCKELSKKCKVVIPMSGTPIVNRPVEFFPVLNMLYPSEFGSFWKYAFRYCQPRKGFRGQGWRFDGATNTEELHERVSPFMIRRMKSEVLTELPPKQRIMINVDITNRREYDSAQNDFLKWLEKNQGKKAAKKASKAVEFVRMGQLRRLAAQGKLKACKAWIDDFLETTDEKLVVFSFHKDIFAALSKHYAKISCFGGKAGPKRKEEVRRFQSDPSKRLFIGSVNADKEAITLTAASTVLFIETGWTPGEQDQAEDRVNRFGQLAKRISAYYLIGRNTIDEHVWSLIEKKRRVVGAVIDGKDQNEEGDEVWEDETNWTTMITKLQKGA